MSSTGNDPDPDPEPKPGPAPDSGPRADGWAAFRHRDFTLYWLSSLLAQVAAQMQMVAIGWQLYDLTRSPLDLGLVGLAEFLPAPLLVLLTGHVADRFERRNVVQLGYVLQMVCALLLLHLTVTGLSRAWPIFGLAFLVGVAKSFNAPANRAMLPNLVPVADLANAATWRSISIQGAFVGGPALGGLLYAVSPPAVYAVAALLLLLAIAIMLPMRRHTVSAPTEPAGWPSVLGGIFLIWRKPVLLGVISLDLFAVLFGGAVALLPIYARDILMVGPEGLGLLRSAPAVGAVVMALFLTRRPVTRRAGRIMFLVVGIFGLFTILFGLSTHFWLSLAALAMLGAADLISVVIRSTLVPLATPDNMRGRVNAVEMVFVGASNELGAFRAGVAAALIGTVPAVVSGGIATLIVVALWIRLFPELYRVERLDEPL
jgi:MFS family permease